MLNNMVLDTRDRGRVPFREAAGSHGERTRAGFARAAKTTPAGVMKQPPTASRFIFPRALTAMQRSASSPTVVAHCALGDDEVKSTCSQR